MPPELGQETVAQVNFAAEILQALQAGEPDEPPGCFVDTSPARRAISMRYVEGLSVQEIAVVLGKTKSAIHRLLFHGLRQMRKCLGWAGRFFSDAGSAAPESREETIPK